MSGGCSVCQNYRNDLNYLARKLGRVREDRRPPLLTQIAAHKHDYATHMCTTPSLSGTTGRGTLTP